MKINNVNINNYKSIKTVSLNLNNLSDDSKTFGLIGVNEAGKSSILKAISLKDNVEITPQDFRSGGSAISIEFFYLIEDDEIKEILKIAIENIENTKAIPEKDSVEVDGNEVNYTDPVTDVEAGIEAIKREEESQIYKRELENFKKILETKIKYVKLNFLYGQTAPPEVEITFYESQKEECKEESIKELSNLEKIKDYLINLAHKTILWKSDSRFLINEPVDLTTFSENPESNIPLRNCFRLAKYKENENIKKAISSTVGDPARIKQLTKQLGKAVTGHIKNIWTDHPIEINFIINDNHITFLIDDIEIENEDELSKTSSQRSDGFKQFISFLLTISAENVNEELKNTILLLDEPETHLHPKAQQLILEDFINLTKNDRNNIVIFATHSNFLIDKNVLNRNYKVYKSNNDTHLENVPLNNSSYLSVNYEVFEIVSEDYHSELYSNLHLKFLENNEEESSSIRNFDTRFFHQDKKLDQKYPEKNKKNAVTLCTYVRNYINHKAECNYEISREELISSIETMRKFL